MFTIALGFATSLVYGFADFFGALGSKHIKPVVVTFWSGLSGLALLLTASIFMGADITPATILCGVIGGIASAFAMTCLYAALAIGPISILSPLSAVVMAIVPMIIGFIQGDHFSLWGWVALATILVAVVLVGFVPGDDVRLPSMRGLLLGVGAGIGMGAVLLALAYAPKNSGLAAPAILRAVSATLLGVFMLVSLWRSRLATRPAKTAGLASGLGAGAGAGQVLTASHSKASAKIWLAVILTGFLDSSANLFFTIASRQGSLSVVSVLTALYPLGTIILARIFLKEKIARSQMVGIALALGASAVLAVA
jgi:drug/metabolite transporter (DMT)-like permease